MDNIETQQYNGEDVAATLAAVAPVTIDLVEEGSAELPAVAEALQQQPKPSKPFNPNSREAKLKKYLAEATVYTCMPA